MKSEYKEEYKNYLIQLSKGIKSEIYSHYDTVNMLLKPVSFGYDIVDTNLLFEKARIMIIIWSDDVGTNGEDVLTYDEFVIKQRDNKLNEIGI